MMLHRKGWPVCEREAAVRTVEERSMGFLRLCRQGPRIDGKTVVHRDDLDLVGGKILHRMIGAMVTLMHFDGLGADRERHHLMTQADAENRNILRQELLYYRHGIFAGCCRVAGPI